MCGITAWLAAEGGEVDLGVLDRMTDALAHRGPDGRGTWLAPDRRAGLGHRRLAILDLSPAGAQPMACPRGRYHLTYNGEIYNFREIKDELAGLGHRFASTGDSEVLLAAYAQWGAGCLPRLRGMFAFAIWDQEDKTLFAARDRLGIKPLYYRERGGELLLASEPKALLAHPACGRGVDPAGLRDFLVHGYLPAPRSIYRELRQLPPAGWLRLAGGRLAIGRYWDPAFAADPAPDEAAWRARLNQALDDAVASHLVSDVPVGAFLSGGIDSSAVVAALGAAGAAQAVQAFCVGFEEGEFDERAKARRVAAHLGVSLTEIVARAPGLAADLDLIAGVYDEPFGDYSALPTLHLCRATADRVKVALSGDGGDENLAGYHGYRHVWRRAADWRGPEHSRAGRRLFPHDLRGPLWWRPGLDRLLARLTGWLPLLETAFERRSRRLMGPLENYYRRNGHWHPEEAARLLRRDPGDDPFWAYEAARDPNLSPVDQALKVGLLVTLPGRMLAKVDRASMAFGLEVRVPLLDHRLVELCAAIPAAVKMKGGRLKHLFLESLRDRLPAEILAQKKAGFVPPVRRWLADPRVLAGLADSIRRNPFLAEQLDPAALERFLALGGHPRLIRRMWDLVVLDRWSRRWLS